MAEIIEKERTRKRFRYYIDVTEDQVTWMRLNVPHGLRSKLLQFLLLRFIEMPKAIRDKVILAMNKFYNQDDRELELDEEESF